ncbi:acyl-CoA thioesterase [Terasakiella sp.]|uniref:acyl-CoA thioesterase n=1 Tax=Terasakiella sp. TaxID=2034861 RepID=UPI003AA841AD
MSEDQVNLTDRANFKFWTPEIFRFADMDALNHLNNIASAVYCETARADFFVKNLGHDFSAKVNWVLANINVSYLAPVHYPNEIEIGTRVKRIGNSSVTLQQGLFCQQGCFSTAETILVFANLETGKSTPLSDDVKEIFAKYN